MQGELSEALALANRMGERIWLPDLWLLEVRVAQGLGDLDAADAALRRSLREAQRQQAGWLVLVSLVALCESAGAHADDWDALRLACASQKQGLDCALAPRADDLLGRINPA